MHQASILSWIDSRHDSLVEELLALTEVNSGSSNTIGLAVMAERLQALFKPISDHCELVDLAPIEQLDDTAELKLLKVGQALCCSRRVNAPLRILLCGHMDTVFSAESSFQCYQYLDDNCVNGPGTADMKGGLLVMLTALTALEQSPFKDQIGWDVVINSDEEIGSLASADLLRQYAASAHVGMVFEPALADGTLAGQRKGSGNFSLGVTGVSAHAGREFDRGRNAIAALASAMQKLHGLNGRRDGVTINLGRIAGGGALNSVAANAICHFNVRTKTFADEDWMNAELQTILSDINQADGFSAVLHGRFNRPPKPLTKATQQLFDWLRESASSLDITINHQPTGGCCDGNNLASAGVPTIDTLGVRGGNIHTDKEFIMLDSLVERAKLSYLLLEKLAANKEQVIANQKLQGEENNLTILTNDDLQGVMK
ncbi:MAG: glutamate carboxypeptidase [Pseudohongiellaceae bacterium]|jgi:glutamate carboxypeptidase